MGTFRNRPTSTENYRNPTHQQYVTGDGWKSGESDTDAPGAKKAKAAGEEGKAGLKAETARPQVSPDMTGKQSMPEQKTKLGVSTVCIKPNGGQTGQIKGGDPLDYLGHFRSPKVLKEGHNQGAPIPPMTSGGGDMPPPSTSLAGLAGGRASNPPPPGFSAASGNVPPPMGAGNRRSGAGTAPVPTQGTVSMRAAKPAMGPAAPAKNTRQPAKMNAMPEKAKLRSAVGGVKAAREKLAGAMKSGANKRTKRVM